MIRRNLPIPAREYQVIPSRDPRRRQHPARGLPDAGREHRRRSTARSWASTSSTASTPTDAEVTIDVGLSYDSNGVVQVAGRSARHGAPAADDRRAGPRRSLVAGPAARDVAPAARPPELIRVFLLIDVSASMTGQPLIEAQTAAREFLSKCDFTTMEVGLISFSTLVALQSPATSNVRRLHAAVAPSRGRGEHQPHRCPGDGARPTGRRRPQAVHRDLDRRLSRCARECRSSRRWRARQQGIEIVAIGTGDADRDYLRRLASSEQASIFARSGELVQTFGHIARVIAEGGRGLRVLS